GQANALAVMAVGDKGCFLNAPAAKSSKARPATGMIWRRINSLPSRAPVSLSFRQHSHSSTAQPAKSYSVSLLNTPLKSICPSPGERKSSAGNALPGL
ncbi:hypothetical protein FK513_28195, partial [Klebsiella pneumoniae]|nr:hypothetical protein [Klebsiella pneumoniae]